MKLLWKRISWTLVALVVLAMLAYAFVPKPVEVDTAAVARGPMRVTVDQDGKTRVKERYAVAAPLGGQMARITLKAGDAVEARTTVIAVIEPTPPQLLDARAREEAEARVRWNQAALAQAEPEIDRSAARLKTAQNDLERAQDMARGQAVSQEELDRRELAVREREAELRMARSARDVAQFQLEQARAALLRTTGAAPAGAAATTATSGVFEVFSPIDGQVLRVIQESEMPVTAGMALVEVGDVRDIEAVIDVLSRDAVNVRPGAPVLLERWGGGEPLNGRVRRVEPSGFTKISALGVEEQRVNVIVDFTDPIEQRPTLGDGFRVDARIVTWARPDVVKLPSGALFRSGDDWATFVMTGGKAHLRPLKLGRMNGEEAEVLEGIQPGERVVLHPSDKIKDGVAIVQRTR